jgi:hypothetical protein
VQYVGTIVATLAGVGVATYLSVRQFYSQAEKKDDERRRQLAQSLAAELLKMLDVFAGGPNLHMADPKATAPHLFPDELGPARSPVSVHLVQLEPTATEEAIRVGLLDPQSTSNLSQLASLMRDYSMLSNNFYPLQYGPIWNPSYQERAYKLSVELARTRINLIIFGSTIITGLASQEIELPPQPQFRSDPNINVKMGGSPHND